MIEIETFQVSFNGVHIDLVRSMPVNLHGLRDVKRVYMELQDDHVAFLDGTAILTPTDAPG